VIAKSCKYLQLGRKIPLHENGSPRRTWLHVSDTAKAIIKIIESGSVNEIYNISGNYEDSNINVVNKIIKLYNSSEQYNDFIDYSVTRSGQDVRYSIDDSKLKSLGWNAEADFDVELSNVVEYYRQNFIW
jgi:dTDP-glucose 4,6-dehydratase